MDRKMVLFLGGVILILALFIPMSVLQDSDPVVGPVRQPRAASKGKPCPPFEIPHAVVGHYECSPKSLKKKKAGLEYVCKLRCPNDMLMGHKKKVTHRCFRGRWITINLDQVYCVAAKSVSLVKQHSAPPSLLNKLVTNSLNHSYSYLAMAYFFDRADVQLPGFHKYFMGLWEKSLSMGKDLMSYINKRGGWIDLKDLPRPRLAEKLHVGLAAGQVGLVAMETAVDMERESQELALEVLKNVERRRVQDPHLLHTIEDHHLNDKVKTIKELVDYVTQLRAFLATGEGDYELGEYEIDNALQ